MEPDAPVVLDAIAAGGIGACVGGGWGVDALLGEQTRAHADLDLWLAAIASFVALGIDRLYPWGNDRPWICVLYVGAHRRVDLHIYEVMLHGDLYDGARETRERFLRPRTRAPAESVIEACDSVSSEWSLR